MASTFKGISFEEIGSSAATFPVFGNVAQSTILRPATGGRIIIQSSGQKDSRLALPISCTGAQLASLNAAVDSVGTLTYHGGTRQAYLESVGDPRRVGVGDYYQATLNFVGL